MHSMHSMHSRSPMRSMHTSLARSFCGGTIWFPVLVYSSSRGRRSSTTGGGRGGSGNPEGKGSRDPARGRTLRLLRATAGPRLSSTPPGGCTAGRR